MIGDISAFRMYVEPLNASQVKHNFKILKERYGLLNPECPNCAIIVPANDLTYELIEATPTPTQTPTPTPTPTSFVFLAQEDYFTIQQEDGFNIIVT
jgi:hypothetical protein